MTTKLNFLLDIDDGWPPVVKECMECLDRKNGYQIQMPPLFMKDLSVGDVVEVGFDDEGDVVSWFHIERSERSTVWIMGSSDYSVSEAIEGLKKMGCNIVEFEDYRYFSIDVPAECLVERLDECLNSLDGERVSIAFPSFRH